MRESIKEWYEPLMLDEETGNYYYQSNNKKIVIDGINEINNWNKKLIIEEALSKIKNKVKDKDLLIFKDYFYNDMNTTELEKKYNMKNKLVVYRIKKVLKKLKEEITK